MMILCVETCGDPPLFLLILVVFECFMRYCWLVLKADTKTTLFCQEDHSPLAVGVHSH